MKKNLSFTWIFHATGKYTFNFTFFAIVFLFLISVSSNAATYYVDQTAGSDNNAGTSANTAWKNSPGMTAYSGTGTLKAGDIVYFDRGDTWLVTGSQGIYLTGGVTYSGDSFGSSGTKATIRANSDLSNGVVRFRDHATIPTIIKGFDLDANNKVSSGVDINHGNWTLMNGAMKRVDNVIVRNVNSRLALGQYKYGIIISNHGGTGGYAENVEILNSVVHDVSRDAICLYPGDQNANTRIKNITVRGCEVYNTGQDPDYCCGAGIIAKGYVVDAFIENNYIHNVKGAGIFINSNETNHFGVGPTNIHIRHNIVTVSNVNGAIRIYDGQSGADPKDLKIYGNIIYNSTVNGGLQIGQDLGNTNKLWVYNNTFYNAPVIISSTKATFSPFEFKNNIVYYPGKTAITGSDRFTSSSNNLTTNPGFKNTANLPTGFIGTFGVSREPNTDGLSGTSSSAVNVGVALSTTYQMSINSLIRPQGAAWDIGAYEYKNAVTGIENLDDPLNSISIYPNPLQENFTLNIASSVVLDQAEIQIYDLCGKKIKSISIQNYETVISRCELQSGIYFYNIMNKNENVAKGKLIVQ